MKTKIQEYLEKTSIHLFKDVYGIKKIIPVQTEHGFYGVKLTLNINGTGYKNQVTIKNIDQEIGWYGKNTLVVYSKNNLFHSYDQTITIKRIKSLEPIFKEVERLIKERFETTENKTVVEDAVNKYLVKTLEKDNRNILDKVKEWFSKAA